MTSSTTPVIRLIVTAPARYRLAITFGRLAPRKTVVTSSAIGESAPSSARPAACKSMEIPYAAGAPARLTHGTMTRSRPARQGRRRPRASATGVDAEGRGQDVAGRDAEQPDARTEGVRGARHRLDRQRPAGHVREGIAGEELDEREAAVEPHGHPSVPRRIDHVDMRPSV